MPTSFKTIYRPQTWVILLFCILGFIAAFMISYEKFLILSNPLYVPSCSLNAWIDCGKVMNSSYATMFGFPNSWLGLMGWPMAFLTVLYILTHQQLSRIFMNIALGITVPAVILSYIWTYIAFFEIQAVCPWCILSCISATITMIALIDLNRSEGFISFPIKSLSAWLISLAIWFSLWGVALYLGIFR